MKQQDAAAAANDSQRASYRTYVDSQQSRNARSRLQHLTVERLDNGNQIVLKSRDSPVPKSHFESHKNSDAAMTYNDWNGLQRRDTLS